MFDDFRDWDVGLDEIVVHGRSGGTGPAVALLHGHPRTHTTWYRVAPLLADGFTVVCPDLPWLRPLVEAGARPGAPRLLANRAMAD